MSLRTAKQVLVEHPRNQLGRDDSSLRVRREEDGVGHPDRLEPFLLHEELLVKLVDALFHLALPFQSDRLDIEGPELAVFEKGVHRIVHHRRKLDAGSFGLKVSPAQRGRCRCTRRPTSFPFARRGPTLP